MMLLNRFLAVTVLSASLAAPQAIAAEDTLAAARDMYAAAAYEEALLVLNRLRAGGTSGPESRLIDQYRAFCLLALGRGTDAERAIESIIIADPLYEPAEDEVSPRVRSAFSEVRKRVLPSIVQQKYAGAKAAYDRREFTAAAVEFKQVLAVMADPDVAPSAGLPPLADIRTLATGFLDLSVAAAAPPPPPPPPPAPIVRPQPVVAGPPPIYGPEDTAVVPPISIRQALPPFPLQGALPPQGVIEVVIAETGEVESAIMRVPLSPAYDRQALAAAREWKYRPASLNGVPVKYRKVIQIAVRR
jgi:hypothetical protein